ncbi:RagB/SusD family nutrient uptake outer membrane protein [Hymenobacter edaphi]|uniref:RagB/SusD family nutrient uptake outer membrane protein n=1 Tax=Hymenobacter edaphi TaxID=2211146 RepID=A0A328BZP9_9BACT|nr:RagB/SusD family nutrient uptake outer membrane protein [Hymenobacter edaphi]RAK70658.1 RagB/SusD family nutrient uptake outer membrane protein [Hymenobacter edaphi]
MKRIHLTALAAGAALLTGLTGCEDALDKTNLGAIDEKLIFNDSTLAKLNVDYLYNQNLPTWFGQTGVGLGNTNPSTLSDETGGDNRFMEGTVTLNDVTDFGTALSATNNYGKIRNINTFLVAVRQGSIAEKSKNRLLAQAYFFRAYRYFDLVRLYGGVPLVLKPLYAVGEAARDEAFMPRNSTSESFRQIASDLDSASMFLPGKWASASDWGRITKGGAAAMKARVLLYAASPQFNPSDDVAKWQAAYNASVDAKNKLTAAGFGLHASYDQMWLQNPEANNPEAVLVSGFNNSTGDQTRKNNAYDNATRPSYTGTAGGSNQPSWDLVQAYPMLDGKKPGETGRYTYNQQLFYKNRDPRFAKTIAFNGATWPLNGNNSYKIWTYYVGNTSTENRASTTGFYLRKAINPSVAASEVQFSGTDWMEIRYAEVLLNLAEAAAGVNNLSEALTQLKAIRQRAGIEPGDGNYGLNPGMNRAQMFEAILYERQIELAFEGKRFWDLRRWKKMESTLNGKRRKRLHITLKSNAPANFATTRDGLNLDQVYTDYFTLEVRDLDTRYNINWRPEYYFFPLPQSAIDNNPRLQQNNTWGGAFDPLQ